MHQQTTGKYGDEVVAFIREQLQDGRSFTSIAVALHDAGHGTFTSGSVAGIVWRYIKGKSPRGERAAHIPVPVTAPPPPPKQRRMTTLDPWSKHARANAHAALPLPTEAPPAPSQSLVATRDLEPHHCRWPFGHPGEDHFGHCGARRDGAGPYCGEHARRAVLRSLEAPSEEAAA